MFVASGLGAHEEREVEGQSDLSTNHRLVCFHPLFDVKDCHTCTSDPCVRAGGWHSFTLLFDEYLVAKVRKKIKMKRKACCQKCSQKKPTTKTTGDLGKCSRRPNFYFPDGKKICSNFPCGKLLFPTEQNFVPRGKELKNKNSVRKKILFRGKNSFDVFSSPTTRFF